MRLRRVVFEIRRTLGTFQLRRFLVSPLAITILAAALVGVTSGEVVARVGSGDRIVVGNTGGTLSALIQTNGALIVIGGGNARTDLADLVGRSTVPWKRHVSLMIVPGWDDNQMIGALGLVERGGVQQLVILGTPNDSAVSRALQQEAARRGVPVTVVTGHNRIELGSTSSLEMQAAQPSSGATPAYAIFTLHYDDSAVTFIDASKDGLKAMERDGVTVERSHVLVEMRTVASLNAQTDVLLEPRAESAATVSDVSSVYTAEIKSGQRLSIRLAQHELRFPLQDLSSGFATPSEPNSTP